MLIKSTLVLLSVGRWVGSILRTAGRSHGRILLSGRRNFLLARLFVAALLVLDEDLAHEL